MISRMMIMSFRTIPQITNSPVGSRRFFHYSEMEEFIFGMWGEIPASEREWHIENAANVMRDTDLFQSNCLSVLESWPKSASTAFSTPSMNLKAWIGHASMCHKYGTPEHHTRSGWRRLTEYEQDLANKAAQMAIDTWVFPDDNTSRQLCFDW